jgi:hypothetical protein
MTQPTNSDGLQPSPWRQHAVLAAFIAVAAFYLYTEHQAHLLDVLPWLLLLACPLMHVFMHRGHGHHGTHGGKDRPTTSHEER